MSWTDEKLTGNDQAENPLVPTETVVIIKPGKNADGFWTNQDLVKQIQERAIPIFRILHPKSKMLLMFDNSQNHRALPPDALNAKVLNLNDGGKNVKLQRPGWFMKQGQRVEQMMQTNAGVQKGLRTILQERGLWENYLSKDSAKSVLEQQPDFRAQKEWIVETVEQNDGIVDFYPKFHCEFNFIEMYWAAAKSYTRRNCTYSWKDLQIVVPKALEQVPLGQIRRFARKCYRYMDAYRIVDASGNRLSVRQAEYAVKKYKRHRSLPESLIAQLD